MKNLIYNWKLYIIIILVLILSVFLINNNFKLFQSNSNDVNISKEIIELQKKDLENKQNYNRNIDSINKKLDSINLNISNQKKQIIYQKSITNKYYKNEEKISNLDISDYSYDSLLNIIKSTKYEPYQRGTSGTGKNN